MRSSPFARTPKSQLAVEQPLRGEHWNPPKKHNLCPKTEKKLQRDGRRGTIIIKSNSIPTGWATHRLEKNNTKEALALLWSFWTPFQASSLGILQRHWIPRESDPEGQWDLIIGLPQDFGEQTRVLEGTNKILHTPRPRGEEQWPHKRLNQNYLVVLEGLLWRCG